MSENEANKAAQRTADQLRKLEIESPYHYLNKLHQVMLGTQITSFLDLNDGTYSSNFSLGYSINFVIELLKKRMLIERKRLMIIGNGGSAAMAMHMLMDYVNVAGIRTMDFTSPPLMSCVANDYGWENVFAESIKKFADERDVLFAISSSGQSKNILNACDAANAKGCKVVTFSGMEPSNSLRKKGDINFYVSSDHYGFIELTHETLLHCILDLFVKGQNNVR